MRKILVIRFSSLGDIILTTPVYRNLRERLPGCEIVSAVKKKYADILSGNPNVDRLLVLGEGESIVRFILRVRNEGFDAILDLHDNVRSNLVTFFSGVPKVARTRKAAWERRLYVKSKIRDPELGRHTLHRYLDTLRGIGIEPNIYPPELPFSRGGPAGPNLRLLVVQTAFLGDAVLTRPLLSALRAAMPGSRIDLLCTPEIEGVFSGEDLADSILVMDKRGKDRGLKALWRWAKGLRGNYDVALVPHRSFRSAFLAWLARIPRRIGFENSQGRFLLTDLVAFDWRTHDSERNLKLLEALGIVPGKPEAGAAAPAAPEGFADKVASFGIRDGDVLVGMNPGSVWATKRWLPQGFAKVADELIGEFRCKVVLFGSPRDSAPVNAVARAMMHQPVNLCGKTDLKTLSHLISRCSLFVTNDSGPMHLASAYGVPVVAVFGPTTRELGFFPYGEKSVMVEADLPCRPCSLHGTSSCPLGHFNCMKDVTPDMVLAPCRRFLKGTLLSI